MIKIENVEVWGFKQAIRGMRNPLNSWAKSDSYETHIEDTETHETAPYAFFVGEKDLDLMQRLYKGGSEHRKFMRQIMVSVDITAPLYWWKEFDTYKIGTTANSCSTMHTIHKRALTMDDFSTEHLTEKSKDVLEITIDYLNACCDSYKWTKDKQDWWQIIQLLPTSFNQKRTVTMNYENAANIIKQRTGHKLDEWRVFCDRLKELPYLAEIMGDAK